MNTELKAMLVVLFKLFSLGKDLVEKAGLIQDFSDVEAIGMAIPSVVAHFSSVQSEISELSDPAHLADILAFIATQFAGVESDVKAQAILSAALRLAGDVTADSIALATAIRS